jgi:hypothetical protein
VRDPEVALFMTLQAIDYPAQWWNLGVMVLGVLVLAGVAWTIRPLLRVQRAPSLDRPRLVADSMRRMFSVAVPVLGAFLFWGFNAHDAATGGMFFRWRTAGEIIRSVAFVVLPVLLFAGSRVVLRTVPPALK